MFIMKVGFQLKMKCTSICGLICLLLLNIYNALCFEPFVAATAGLIGVVGIFSNYPRNALNYAKCITGFNECCNDHWIHFDILGLKRNLSTHLFGQHIVQQIVPAALSAQRYNPSKPLVMSFHGWPGGGKNYVSLFIALSMFKKGVDSKFYHYFNGRTDFPLESKTMEYQDTLRSWITANVTLCGKSLFVFDEVDKMTPGVLDGIKPFLDHHNNIRGVDYRNAVFIFLSNIGGNLITNRYLELWRTEGKSRHQMTSNDFDNILLKGAFNEIGGLQRSDVIDHSLVDHFVPFLPLEKIHIEQCIIAELKKRNHSQSSEIINEVMTSVMLGPNPEKLFSTSGCKRLSQKVSAIIERERLHDYLDL